MTDLRRAAATVWLPIAILDRMRLEADAKAPLETGGVVLGYWASAAEVVVTACGSPGPDAVHLRHAFKHDERYDERLITERYQASDGVETYLGTWHTHPGTRHASPSRADRRALRLIATSAEARAPRPLMIIMAGPEPAWMPHAYVGELRPLLAGWRYLAVADASVRMFARSLA